MTITRERFAQGLTYDQFKDQMTRNRERFETNERDLTLDPTDVAAFAALPQPLSVLVLAEDWCADVIDNLPILGRLAQASGKLNPRVFPRDANLDLMDQYLKDGQYRSIPVFVFLDDQFHEIGRFIERPASVTERRARQRAALFAAHPEFGAPGTSISQLPEETRLRLSAAMADERAQSRAQDAAETVRELRDIVAPVRA